MIREEFLPAATKNNLYCARLIRDAAALAQTGLKVGDVSLYVTLERLKMTAEKNLDDAVRYASGFVHCEADSCYLTAHTLGCESRTAALGVRLNMKPTSDEHACLKGQCQPPVGMRGTLFDLQVELSANNGICAGELSRMLACTANEQTQGKRLTAFSLNAIDCLRTVCGDAAAVCARFAAKEDAALCSRPDIIDRLSAECAKTVDLTESELVGKADFSAYAAAAAGGTIKSTLCPLWFDFCYRYSLSVK